MMALTKDFKDTMQACAQRDPALRKALLQEGVECLLAGDVDTGKAMLRDYVNATIGFEGLPRVFDKSSKGKSEECRLSHGTRMCRHFRSRKGLKM
jgi:hypothetical protein